MQIDMNTLFAYDTSLESIHVLLAGLDSSVQAVAVDPSDDALATIDAALAESGARKLLVLCHGQAGELRLGAEPIQRKQLVERAGTLASWGLESIELYACHAGADAAFVQTLEQLSGATVAASSGVVGHASLGGSWTLQGSASNAIAPFSRAAIDQWAVALTQYSVAKIGASGINISNTSATLILLDTVYSPVAPFANYYINVADRSAASSLL